MLLRGHLTSVPFVINILFLTLQNKKIEVTFSVPVGEDGEVPGEDDIVTVDPCGVHLVQRTQTANVDVVAEVLAGDLQRGGPARRHARHHGHRHRYSSQHTFPRHDCESLRSHQMSNWGERGMYVTQSFTGGRGAGLVGGKIRSGSEGGGGGTGEALPPPADFVRRPNRDSSAVFQV